MWVYSSSVERMTDDLHYDSMIDLQKSCSLKFGMQENAMHSFMDPPA